MTVCGPGKRHLWWVKHLIGRDVRSDWGRQLNQLNSRLCALILGLVWVTDGTADQSFGTCLYKMYSAKCFSLWWILYWPVFSVVGRSFRSASWQTFSSSGTESTNKYLDGASFPLLQENASSQENSSVSLTVASRLTDVSWMRTLPSIDWSISFPVLFL